MGHYYEDKNKEMGFPDEFGEDICRQNQKKPEAEAKVNPEALPPFCGYVAPGWFGPFLLSPHSRRERGCC